MGKVSCKRGSKPKTRKSRSCKRISNYEVLAAERAEGCLVQADSLIGRFEDDGMFEEPISEEELTTELDYIRDQLDDCAEDGWTGYRDAMDRLSNRLWLMGVAWPQYLPPWSWADVVNPEDLKHEIWETCLYREDLLAIRQFSDSLKFRFKDAVHILVSHARETIVDFPKERNSSKVRKSSRPRRTDTR